MAKVFEVTDKEHEAAKAWMKEQKELRGADVGTIGDRWSWRFTPTAIGTAVEIIDNATSESCNLTDFSEW